MNVTREMIAAAHDVTMRHKIVLAHDLLSEIYQAMGQTSPASKPLTYEQQQAMRLYTAVERLALQAGEETDATVDWLCGEYGGMAKLFETYFGPQANQTTEFCPMCEGKPAPRKPLTENRIMEIFNSDNSNLGEGVFGFVRAIEAAHGIKGPA